MEATPPTVPQGMRHSCFGVARACPAGTVRSVGEPVEPQRGFTLLETLVSVAVAVLLAWLLFHVLTQALLTSRLQSARDSEQSTVNQLVDNLTTEEDDAWAIFVPPNDVL